MAETQSKGISGALDIVGGITGIATSVMSFLGMSKAQKKQLELQEKEQVYQHSLSTLSNEQTFVLNEQLNTAKTETERLAILTNAITQIKLQQQQNSNSGNNQKVILIVSIMLIALLLLIVSNRNK